MSQKKDRIRLTGTKELTSALEAFKESMERVERDITRNLFSCIGPAAPLVVPLVERAMKAEEREIKRQQLTRPLTITSWDVVDCDVIADRVAPRGRRAIAFGGLT